ncbi:MAG: hypothetical protein GEU80_12265 [Dehalococcoidia bacterium]|nr:hypothetical protein [Dehalococcoidia bacterium]
MPKFTKLSPNEVVLGRGRAAAIARKPYIEVIQDSEAGMIELDTSERPATVKRLLREAAKEVGVKVRSSWTDDRQRALVWKRVRNSR